MDQTLPASAYVDPHVHGEERARIFGAEWLCAGHIARLPEGPGAFAADLGGLPIVVTRDAEGAVRAFHNVCRHRAGPLLWAGQSERCRALRCRYHGWQFGLDGALRKAPGFGGPLPDAPLFPLAAAVRHGLIFVHPDAGTVSAPPALDALLAPLGLAGMTLHAVVEHPLACNWKTYVENYLEGYHIPYLHPGLAREIDVEAYAVDVHDGYAVHRVPPADGAQNEGLWAWLWPNTALNVYRGGLSLERIVPDGPERCHIEYTYVFDAALPEAARAERVAMSASVTDEDKRIVEAVQRNLSAGRYQRGWLSPRHEGALQDFQARVARALGSA